MEGARPEAGLVTSPAIRRTGPTAIVASEMLRLFPVFVLLATTMVVPAAAACCAGFEGCPTAEERSSDCCDAAADDPQAKQCCDSAASSELTLLGAQGKDLPGFTAPPATLAKGHGSVPAVSQGHIGGSRPPARSGEPLYTLHSVLLI